MAEFSPDGNSLVGIDSNGAAAIWCARSGVVLHRSEMDELDSWYVPRNSSNRCDFNFT